MDPALPDDHADNWINDTQINWLELARFAAAGEGHADLGRGVNRLAALAAAVHRGTARFQLSTVSQETEKGPQGVHGRTHQAQPITEDGR